MGETIEHVSDTAFWVAYYRALESKRKDALFHDPLAEKLVGPDGAKLARRMGSQRAMAWSMSLRTHIIDVYIAEAIAKGVDTVINLGAGLDTRPYRLDLSSQFQWVEVDFPPVIDYKNKVLVDDKPCCELRQIGCDLSDDASRRDLLTQLNQDCKNALVLTEGVIPYLTNKAVADLARDLDQQNHITYWLTDYFSPLFAKVGARGKIRKRLAANAPFRFFPGQDPMDWPRFFAELGWEIGDMRYIGEVGRTLGRDLPAPWIFRMLMRFAKEEKLRPYRRMNGYALLVRGRNPVSLD